MCFCLQEWFCLAMDLSFYALKIKNANDIIRDQENHENDWNLSFTWLQVFFVFECRSYGKDLVYIYENEVFSLHACFLIFGW